MKNFKQVKRQTRNVLVSDAAAMVSQADGGAEGMLQVPSMRKSVPARLPGFVLLAAVGLGGFCAGSGLSTAGASRPAARGDMGSATRTCFDGCYADLVGDELVVGNRSIERRWRVRNGLLYPTSLRDLASGREWLARPEDKPSPYPAGPLLSNEERSVTFKAESGVWGATQAPSLYAELTAAGREAALTYRFQVFPDSAGVVIDLTTERLGGGANAGAPVSAGRLAVGTRLPSGIEADPTQGPASVVTADVLDSLALASPHLRLTEVTLVDRTDQHNELVFEKEWLLQANEADLSLNGNVFVLEDPLTGAGLVILKQAPLPGSRPVRTDGDLRVSGEAMRRRPTRPASGPLAWRMGLLGHGTDATDGRGYRSVVLVYQGGEYGRIAALQTHQRQWRRSDPAHDLTFASNTWGDRNRDSRIQERFLLEEIDAGARLGVEVIQIDDGWQKGRSSNSANAGGKGVWEGFWSVDPNFWDPDPIRFPRGLTPVIGLAREKGLAVGLWYAPDSSDDFANWERDASQILTLHRTLNVRHFKIDSLSLFTKLAERRCRQFYERILTESKGAIVFDLDVTAGVRPGYFGTLGTGPIYVENRYTDWLQLGRI